MSDPNTNAAGHDAPAEAGGQNAQQPVTLPPPPPGHAADAAGRQPGAQGSGRQAAEAAAPHGGAGERGAAPAAPAAPRGPQPGEGRAGDSGPRLSTFLKISIVLLAGLTLASISLLFIGDFEGKFERVFSTFVLFAVFVLFTALDTRRGQKSEWYAPVALIANAYILGLLLIVIWMTGYDRYTLMWEIFWKSVFVILVTRLVILCCQLLLTMGAKLSAVVTRFAFVTSVLAVLSGILFTAPVGIDAFGLHVPDLYWKIATALLILTALGLSITLLLRWSYGSEAREAAREAARARGGVGPVAGPPYVAQQLQAPPLPQQSQPQPQAPAQAPAPQGGRPLLPWPTFPDGRPLPAGPDGQPDFSVLGHGRP
ncbi:hypothetical protein [Leucobacter massiliensis]|uniref:Uncharacterized protein n=1 Tax=Leucobacter massiliensis TaxID=1686285 RepID=A0A2S9QLT1_9MICO|nr:hypothetical protein [Leucobacter massiliensis]PRI10537.1 hypothetical protein B4915_11065 [Leucobacter massiliensis]